MPQSGFQGSLHFQGSTDTDGVGNANLLHPDGLQCLGHAAHGGRGHFTFVRATDCAGDRAPNGNAIGPGGVGHRPEALNTLFNRTIDVPVAKGFTRSGKHHDLIRPVGAGCRQNRFHTFHIGCQHSVTHAGAPGDSRHHLGVVGHLRHPLGTDITGDLNLLEPRFLQTVHQLDLHGCADR